LNFIVDSLIFTVRVLGVLVVALVECRTRDRKVAGSTPGQGAGQVGQLSLSSLWGR